MTEDKYFKQVKCPDCTWSQYQDSEPCAMTPCDRCNSTGYILLPVFDRDDTSPAIENPIWDFSIEDETITIDVECQERVEKIKREIERKSWNTPYISIDEQLAGKEPVVYREVKMEEAQWQSLWDVRS